MTIHSCPNCGLSFECTAPRHAPRGSGAHYSDRIVKLNRVHEHALDALRDAHAVSYETGIGLSQVWFRVRDRCVKYAEKIPTKQGVSGRLSELAGMGKVRTQSHVRLVDQESMQFRSEKQPRWFLA